MTNPIEKVCSKTLNGTLKVLSPIKKAVIQTSCEVHVFIQAVALDILRIYGYKNEYLLFSTYISEINKGIVWADEDFKSRYHFYNPNCSYDIIKCPNNALTLANRYYQNALRYYELELYEKSMFYFGAACHLVQDLTVPQHAKATILDNHIQFESYVKSKYKNNQSFRSADRPILLGDINEYINYNAFCALRIDEKYRCIKNLNKRFCYIAIDSLSLAQETSAGCMIMFFNDIFL